MRGRAPRPATGRGLAGALLAAAALAVPALADPPLGFFAASARAQAEAEAVARATPTPAKARRWLAHLTEEPHVAGTPRERELAEWVRDKLESFGLEAEIVSYDVYLSHPRRVALALTEPEAIELSLMEEHLPEDKDSAPHTAFPGFHGYAASGTAEGQVVYANYGTPDDFERLEEMGIEVAGKIVLARYGRVFRGLKVREAEARGAAGVVLYSDPADDGYMRGDVYPAGRMRPPSAIQRGSVQFLSVQPGDPSTPGWPARDGARRVPRAEMANVPKIPSLPLAYGEAEKILRRLGGEAVPDGWQGGLPFAYHLGPGGAALRLEVEMDDGLMPIHNVVGRIPGAGEPERFVVLGNHRDAWAHGAVDPNSGTAAWLETARALAAALETGWRPKRTILMASWDAEEYGLVGSVEWGEDRAADLAAGAVAYLNLDSAATGSDFNASGVPSLRDLVREVAAAVPEPRQGGTIGEHWERRLLDAWARDEPVDLSAPDPAFELHLPPLGSGSDYTVFLDHLGVPSIDFRFSGGYGVYHSTYDSFRWMDEFGDPEFLYHQAAARFYALAAMRLAAADVVPLTFGSYARALGRHVDELRRRVIREARTPAGEDSEEPPPLAVDFAPLLDALAGLQRAAEAADAAVAAIVERQDAEAAARANAALIGVERAFLSEDGLPERPWFRHLLWAPGLTTGYAAWPFPELAQAVEDRDPELFARGLARAVAALGEAAARLRQVGAG